MIIISFLWAIVKWVVGLVSYGIVAWLLPLIIVLVILSVMGVKVGRLGSAALRNIGNAIVASLTWIVEQLPKLWKLIKRFYIFLSKRCFGMLPTWVANCLAILIIVII